MTYTITEINVETGEEVNRPMTKAEIAKIEAEVANTNAQLAAIETQAQAKAALLTRLGITAEEAALLLK
jgi:hypothetical protein